MTQDLLTKIRREMHEHMDQLRFAVEERDRLQAGLEALHAEPEPPAALNVDPGPSADLKPSAAVLPFPVRREPARTPVVSPRAPRLISAPPRPARTRMVSPKILRLMLVPRRSALERSGIPRVGARPSKYR
jgi:hypothetical protein